MSKIKEVFKKIVEWLVVWGKPIIRKKLKRDLLPILLDSIDKNIKDEDINEALKNTIETGIDEFSEKLL